MIVDSSRNTTITEKQPLDDMNEVLEDIREEFDEHLASINENTNEIQANYEYICSIDAKLNKLSERIDQMQMFMQKYGFKAGEDPKFECQPLTKKEQEVFLLLYTLEEKGPVTYKNISKKSGIKTELVSVYITNLIEKGVPILKRYIHDKVYLRLEKQFKKVQAKQNILKISQTTIRV